MKSTRIMMTIGGWAMALLFPGVPAIHAQSTIHVPGDFPSIQAGLNAASPGDTVLVAAGTYSGTNNRNLNFYGKAVSLRSEAGAGSTIIDAQQLGRGFVFSSGEGNDTVVDGFTITNGLAEGYGTAAGGGIYSNGASPTIQNCIITYCHSDWFGGGMYARSGSPIVRSCTFRNNDASRSGGGYYGEGILEDNDFISNTAFNSESLAAEGGGASVGYSGEIKSCRFLSNQASRGAGLFVSSDRVIVNCLFVGNEALLPAGTTLDGGAIYADSGWINIEYCTFSGNDAIDSGVSVYSRQAEVEIFHSIVWDWNGLEADTGGVITATYSDIRMASGTYPGTGIINADPLFVTGPGDAGSNSFYLSQTAAGQGVDSPAVNAGNIWAPLVVYCDFGYGENFCMDEAATRTDRISDEQPADLGYHYFSGWIFGDDFESGNMTGWTSSQR